jgi:hypothetical protein
MELKRSSLSPLNFWHLVRKWVSSSISWFVQFLHILLFLSILVFLPVSIKSLWEDVRNLQMDFLYSYFFTNVKYFSNLKLVFKNKYVVSFPSFNDLLVSFQSDKYFWLRHFLSIKPNLLLFYHILLSWMLKIFNSLLTDEYKDALCVKWRFLLHIKVSFQGWIQDFKIEGGGAHLKKMR